MLCGCHLPCSPCLQDSGMIQVFSVPPSDHLPSLSSLPVFLPSQAVVLHPMATGRTRKESQSSVSVIDLHRTTHKTIHLEQKWGMRIAVHDMQHVWSTCMHVMYTKWLGVFFCAFYIRWNLFGLSFGGTENWNLLKLNVGDLYLIANIKFARNFRTFKNAISTKFPAVWYCLIVIICSLHVLSYLNLLEACFSLCTLIEYR